MNENNVSLSAAALDAPEFCLRCGLPETDKNHKYATCDPKVGWHPFRVQAYLDSLEDALLFARENKQPHQWQENGITIDTFEPFHEKYCTVCGAINWGGIEDGICFGNNYAELALVAAHNRRAFSRMEVKLDKPK